MDELEALAIGYANLKGSKRKALIATAKAFDFYKRLPGYGSNAKVGAVFGVSGEIVREFLLLLRFPPEIQQLFEKHQLGLEQGRKLWQFSQRRPELLSEAARAISELSAMDARNLVEHLLKHPEVSVAEARDTILESKTIKERQYHVVAILSEEDYKRLVDQARLLQMPIDHLVTSIVKKWLEAETA